ncbi:MAG: N-acetylmuramoyl-L-alanine amidase [Pseudomonadota bacterium]
MIAIITALLLAAPASADLPQDAVEISEGWWGRLTLRLPLAAPVPWSVALEAAPPRLVVTAEGADWVSPGDADIAVTPGRMVLTLQRPMEVEAAQMITGAGGAAIEIALVPGESLPTVPAPERAAAPAAPLVVALDPGHGGHDPGAEGGGTNEADLMLTFAGELAEILRAAGHDVVLTREGDDFLGLRRRPSAARALDADVFLSLHADAVAGGGAAGAAVYTLSEIAPEALSAEIVARQGANDLIRGVTLDAPGDEVARVLVEMARRDVAPRSDALADALVEAMRAGGIGLHKRPRLGGAFTVLKAPDMPSVLVELGFLSDPGDVANLIDPAWRNRMAQAIATGIDAWAVADAAQADRRLR